MNDSRSNSSLTSDSDGASGALRELLYTAVLTLLLLVPTHAREIVSIEATAAAVGSGTLIGAIVTLTLEDAQLGFESDVVTTIVGMVGLGVVAVLLWIVLPAAYIGTFVHFAIAFMWGSSLIAVVRHVIWPRIGASSFD
ncbi:hypothetical protein [Natrinema sp. DC36]|uniref:hypothetical protein n=1 Tax=Natrinema sp. DC36 TaxID=2878680 RepID=UPI001CEFF77F|nr:hypothetical protein [Natrinema sp. DC36]